MYLSGEQMGKQDKHGAQVIVEGAPRPAPGLGQQLGHSRNLIERETGAQNCARLIKCALGLARAHFGRKLATLVVKSDFLPGRR